MKLFSFNVYRLAFKAASHISRILISLTPMLLLCIIQCSVFIMFSKSMTECCFLFTDYPSPIGIGAGTGPDLLLLRGAETLLVVSKIHRRHTHSSILVPCLGCVLQCNPQWSPSSPFPNFASPTFHIGLQVLASVKKSPLSGSTLIPHSLVAYPMLSFFYMLFRPLVIIALFSSNVGRRSSIGTGTVTHGYWLDVGGVFFVL